MIYSKKNPNSLSGNELGQLAAIGLGALPVFLIPCGVRTYIPQTTHTKKYYGVFIFRHFIHKLSPFNERLGVILANTPPFTNITH